MARSRASFTVDPEDRDLFRQTVGAVKPLRCDRIDPVPVHPAPIPRFSEADEQQVLADMISDYFEPADLETGEELPIHKTNHILRSVVIPAGNHTLTMTFEPSTYYTSITYSWIGWIVVYLGLAFFGFQYYQHRQKPEETTA